jgi:hypothetical protein
MLHLAQVQQATGEVGLRLLARQEGEYTWTVMTEEVVIPAHEANNTYLLSEGLLALVELSSTGKILNLQNATNWVMELVQVYLTSGITPAFLQQECERAEDWRQNLTLQNQELARRLLELEARREQIEALEEGLKRDKEGDNQEERRGD